MSIEVIEEYQPVGTLTTSQWRESRQTLLYACENIFSNVQKNPLTDWLLLHREYGVIKIFKNVCQNETDNKITVNFKYAKRNK